LAPARQGRVALVPGIDACPPAGVVHELQRRRGSDMAATARGDAVALADLAREQAHRPAVADEMVDDELQYMQPRRLADQDGPGERWQGGIEGRPGILAQQALGGGGRIDALGGP